MALEKELTEELAAMGIPLPAGAAPRLIRFLELLQHWNRRTNLTAITDPREALEKHLIDSLTLLPYLEGTTSLLDIGSGGGLPCLPLQIVLSLPRVVSVEAVRKKLYFQRQAIRELGISGVETVHGRGEQVVEEPGFRGSFDVVVARAFTGLAEFAALAVPALAREGRLIAMKGAEGPRELAAAFSQLRALGLTDESVRRLRLPLSGSRRTLIFLRREN